MKHRDYVAAQEANDAEFKAAREDLRPEYEFRRALIEVPKLTSEQSKQALENLEQARQLGISIFGPTRGEDVLQEWELLNESRDERTSELP